MIEDATNNDYARKILDSNYFFPTTVDQALIMLNSLLLLIYFISVEDRTVATEGYGLGNDLIEANRRKIHIRQQEDKLSTTKFLHQLDHNGQNFYNNLIGVLRDPATSQDPLAYAQMCRAD